MGVSTQGEADLLAAWRVELEGSPYEAVCLLGRGGMGAVFEVVHRALGQRRVLKLVAEIPRHGCAWVLSLRNHDTVTRYVGNNANGSRFAEVARDAGSAQQAP